MLKAIETTAQPYLKTDLPDIRPGDTVRVHQKIKEASSVKGSAQVRERVQIFEGIVLAKKHGKGISATITVRKISRGVAVERIFPVHAPFIQKIEVVKRSKVRRAKLYYLRNITGKKARLKAKELGVEVAPQSEKSKPADVAESEDASA